MRPLYHFEHITILAIINTETVYYHIIQYKFDSDGGWASNCFSIANAQST